MSKKPKVLIIEENSFVPADLRVWYEATTLRDAGWDVSVICPLKIDSYREVSGAKVAPIVEDLDDVTVYRFPLVPAEQGIVEYLREYLAAFISVARFSWRDFKQAQFDVIHICNPPDIFFPIAFFYRMLGVKIIFDHHDLFPEMSAWRYKNLSGKLLYALARIMEFFTFRSANIIISTNESYRRIAVQRGRVAENRVFVVRNGPKTSEFQPVKPVPALKRGFRYMACFAGVMGPEDGLQELVNSIRYIVCDRNRKDIRFVLLGDGSVRKEAMAEIEACDLDDFVEMPGMIRDRELLRQYLCTADVLLSPEPLTPLNNSSTFIKIGEYMALGKPTVAYDLRETRYTAQESAVYVEPGNFQEYGEAILALVDDPALREHMGEIGRLRFRDRLAWDFQEKILLEAYGCAAPETGEQGSNQIQHTLS